MQKTWAAAESAFHILGWQGWNVLASLWLCDPSPSMLGTRNNQIFHKSLKRHGKQLAAIWQPQTNKSQNLVAAKNNSNKNKADYYDRAVITDRCGWVNCCKFIISWPSITTTTTVSVVQFTHWSETLSYLQWWQTCSSGMGRTLQDQTGHQLKYRFALKLWFKNMNFNVWTSC